MNVLDQVAQKAFVARTLAGAGVIRPIRPDKLARIAVAYARWGASPALGIQAGAIPHPNQPCVVDALGQLTYADVDRRSTRLANALREAGVGEGDGVAILCRNHRGFIDATLAVAKLGGICQYLNTGFAAPQVKDVVEREGSVALIYDD